MLTNLPKQRRTEERHQSDKKSCDERVCGDHVDEPVQLGFVAQAARPTQRKTFSVAERRPISMSQ